MKMMALYYSVEENHDFEKAANILLTLIRDAQRDFPNKPRAIFLDIEGHRNEEGGFDVDTYELQFKFAMEFLLPYVTELHMPLINLSNNKEQINVIPDALEISYADE